jgi:hypothetical protein
MAFGWGMVVGLGLAWLLVALQGCAPPSRRADAYPDLKGLSAREQLERVEGLFR